MLLCFGISRGIAVVVSLRVVGPWLVVPSADGSRDAHTDAEFRLSFKQEWHTFDDEMAQHEQQHNIDGWKWPVVVPSWIGELVGISRVDSIVVVVNSVEVVESDGIALVSNSKVVSGKVVNRNVFVVSCKSVVWVVVTGEGVVINGVEVSGGVVVSGDVVVGASDDVVQVVVCSRSVVVRKAGDDDWVVSASEVVCIVVVCNWVLGVNVVVSTEVEAASDDAVDVVVCGRVVVAPSEVVTVVVCSGEVNIPSGVVTVVVCSG